MVQRQVQNQLHIPSVAQVNQFLQILLRAECGINPVIIRYVIFMIGRRKENRRQPDAPDSEAAAGNRIPVVQVIHPVDDSPKVPGTVSVGIGEGTHKNLIKYPGIILRIRTFFFPRG